MRLLPLSVIPLFLLAACERDDSAAAQHSDPKGGKRIHVRAPGTSAAPVDVIRRLRELPADAQVSTLADQVHHLSDEDLPTVVTDLIATEDAELRHRLLGSFCDETTLRPPSTRLPLLLEIARHPDLNPDLRNTIVAELGTALDTDHGSSWGDWALALEEHLARAHGWIRVEE